MSDSWDIVSFDIGSEIFSVIKGPPLYDNVETDIGSTSDDFLDVRVIKGDLCFVCYSIYRLDVWVMKKYGDDQSWIKKHLCDDLRLEFHLVSTLLEKFPLIRDLHPHMVSLVSHVNPKEEVSGGKEGSLNLEQWTKTLNPIAPGPRPNKIAIAFEEDPEEVEEVEEVGDTDKAAKFLNVLRLLNL